MISKRLSYFVNSLLIISIISIPYFQCGAMGKLNIRPAENNNDLVSQDKSVKLGIDVLIEKQFDIVDGKRVGLITNPSGVNRNLKTTIDVLFDSPSVKLRALFSPEHGIRGNIEGGKQVRTYKDEKTGVTVYSLYGDTRKPTNDMLYGLDVLLFDIQDVGVRPYTYIYTMAYAMEAAKEAGIPFVVLDRPNPLGGLIVDGNVLDEQFKSFIGLYPIPYVHGMTAGELAWMFNLEFGIGVDLTVVPVEGWTRNMTWEETGLEWVPTSPHIPEAETVPYFAATGCLGELSTFQTGVGYTMPFRLTGAPWIDPEVFANELNKRKLAGVKFRPMYWTPYYGKYNGEQVAGVQLHITDKSRFFPFATGIHLLDAVRTLYPEQEIFNPDRLNMFNKAAGTDEIYRKLQAGVPADVIIDSYSAGLKDFLKMRQEYLLY
ncbi:exo-beta-N-acetylmuramidase NamZ domain-containing protein [candidate division KSB1 bacterium]